MDVDFGLFDSYNPSDLLTTSVDSSSLGPISTKVEFKTARNLNVWRERVKLMAEAALSSVIYEDELDQGGSPWPHDRRTLAPPNQTRDSHPISFKYRSLSEARLSRRSTVDRNPNGPCPKRRVDTVGARLRERQLEELKILIETHKSELALIELEIQRYTSSLDMRS